MGSGHKEPAGERCVANRPSKLQGRVENDVALRVFIRPVYLMFVFVEINTR